MNIARLVLVIVIENNQKVIENFSVIFYYLFLTSATNSKNDKKKGLDLRRTGP